MRGCITPEINMHHGGLFETEVSRPMTPIHYVSEIGDLPEVFTLPKTTRNHAKKLVPKQTGLRFAPKNVVSLDIESIPKSCPTSARRPKSVMTKQPFKSFGRSPPRPQSRLPTTNEIKNLRKQVESNQPRVIHWGSSTDQMPYYNNLNIEVEPEEPNPDNIIKDQEEIDISRPLQPVGLISNTASIMDYCGIPSSLTFIR